MFKEIFGKSFEVAAGLVALCVAGLLFWFIVIPILKFLWPLIATLLGIWGLGFAIAAGVVVYQHRKGPVSVKTESLSE
jgi:hypothetical protein